MSRLYGDDQSSTPIPGSGGDGELFHSSPRLANEARDEDVRESEQQPWVCHPSVVAEVICVTGLRRPLFSAASSQKTAVSGQLSGPMGSGEWGCARYGGACAALVTLASRRVGFL